MDPVLKTPCHKYISGSGHIAAHIHNFGTRWRQVVTFMPHLLYLC